MRRLDDSDLKLPGSRGGSGVVVEHFHCVTRCGCLNVGKQLNPINAAIVLTTLHFRITRATPQIIEIAFGKIMRNSGVEEKSCGFRVGIRGICVKKFASWASYLRATRVRQ